MNLIRTTVTGQYLCGFADDQITGHGRQSVPVWGSKTEAQKSGTAASVANLAKCHLAGMFAVEVEHAK